MCFDLNLCRVAAEIQISVVLQWKFRNSLVFSAAPVLSAVLIPLPCVWNSVSDSVELTRAVPTTLTTPPFPRAPPARVPSELEPK